uniref:NAD-dependent epimerase/dehydratase family protein n=1 Tax=uncultured Mucilaginibacter sp. TaxID=797541 RepID=UPI0025EFDA87
MYTDKILVIGANGQIGTALLPVLQNAFGINHVIGSDLFMPDSPCCFFEKLDATNAADLANICKKHNITQIYHLAAILSAKGEADPVWAWNLNMTTLLNVFEVARSFDLKKVFVPSSIAVFGGSAQKKHTPQHTYLDPTTVYGVSKVAAENWSVYYHKRYGIDIRSLRYPGVISYQSMPGGGTTDYAVDMFHKAITEENYICYLTQNTCLPMIYIDDALQATLNIMEAPSDKIKIRSSYNLSGLSFTPGELIKAINVHLPDFTCDFLPDFRQSIADSWPYSIDDSEARKDWGWKPVYDLEKMTTAMFSGLS